MLSVGLHFQGFRVSASTNYKGSTKDKSTCIVLIIITLLIVLLMLAMQHPYWVICVRSEQQHGHAGVQESGLRLRLRSKRIVPKSLHSKP